MIILPPIGCVDCDDDEYEYEPSPSPSPKLLGRDVVITVNRDTACDCEPCGDCKCDECSGPLVRVRAHVEPDQMIRVRVNRDACDCSCDACHCEPNLPCDDDSDLKSRKNSFETALRDLGDSLIDPTLEHISDDKNGGGGGGGDYDLTSWLNGVRSRSGKRISEDEMRKERENVESSRRRFLGVK